MKLRPVAAALIALACLAASPAKAAEEYPCQGTVRFVVGLPAGSTTDAIVRQIAGEMAPLLKRTIIVENIVGADGALGARNALASAADGCNYLAATNGMLGIEQRLGPQGFDLEKAVPVGMFARNYQVLVVHPAVAANLGELLAYVKANPGTQFARSATSSLIACAYFAKKAGLAMKDIFYKGDPLLMQDVVAGRVPVACPFLYPVRGQIEAGALRALAILGPGPFSELPTVPAITNVLPGSEKLGALEGRGFFVCPPGCPEAAVEMFSRYLREILAKPATVTRFRESSAEAVYMTPGATALYIKSQKALFTEVVREIGLEFKPK